MVKINVNDFNSFLKFKTLLLFFNLFGFANFLSLYFYKKNLFNSIIMIEKYFISNFLFFLFSFLIYIVFLKIIFYVIKMVKTMGKQDQLNLNKIKNIAIITNNKVLYDLYKEKKKEIEEINDYFLLSIGYIIVFLLNYHYMSFVSNKCLKHFMFLWCIFLILSYLIFFYCLLIVFAGDIEDEHNIYINSEIKKFIIERMKNEKSLWSYRN